MKAVMNHSRMTLDTAKAQEALDTYMSSLADLTVNSKPHINSLTMLAEDYHDFAEAIVRAVDDHLKKVQCNVKLPVLYLIDSIIKNVGKDYTVLFSSIIVQSFCSVFQQVDEKTRGQMYKLRQTWNDIFSQEDLYQMDVKVHALDPGWPITAVPAATTHKIHVNPKFFQATTKSPAAAVVAVSPTLPQLLADNQTMEAELREQLLQKKKGLLQLQQERVDLELFQMKAKLNKLDKKSKNVMADTATQPVKEGKDVLQAVPVASVMREPSEILVKQSSPAPKDLLKKAEKMEASKQEAPASVMQDKALEAQPAQIVTTSTRIAPVSSGLVNLVASQRSLRDPRLSKQSSEQISEDISKPSRDPRLSIKVDSKSRSPDKQLLSSRCRSADKELSRSRSSEKESSQSRSSEKDLSRSRSADKDISSQSRSSEKDSVSKTSRHRSRDSSSDRSSRQSSRRDEKEKRSSDRKSNRKSEDRILPRLKKSSSSSSSPSKSSSKRDRRRNRSRSPRQSSRTQHRAVSDCADSQDSDGGVSTEPTRERGKSPHLSRVSQPSTTSTSDWPVNYTKGTHKRRNYMTPRRQESPEAVTSSVASDVDLRVGGPPEKQSRLSDAIESSLSASVPAGVPEQSKKRQSAEPEEGPPPSKKNKAAYMEMLFGNQDVDLRQMDAAEVKNGVVEDTPSPPPPPVISTPSLEGQVPQENSRVTSHGWSKFKQTMPAVERSPAFPRSSRNERLGRTFGDKEDRSNNEDTDMRLSVNGYGSSKPDLHAILSRASEQFKNGTMSRDDYNKVQQQVFQMNETEKLKEVQRNEYTRRDAWERRPLRERDYRHGMGSPNSDHFGDIDERYPKTQTMSRTNKKPLLPLPSVPPIHPRDGSWEDCGPQAPLGVMRMAGPYIRPPRPPRGLLRPPGGPPGPTPWRPGRFGHSVKDNTIALPPADSHILKRIDEDPTKTITIDGTPREIRFYGDDAVVFLSGDDPREIAFDPGEATIILDDTIILHANFHEPAKEVKCGSQIHRIRLGAPTRELYIDDEGFECQFNRSPIEIILRSGERHFVQLEAKAPPKVHVGVQRRDLVAGRIILVIDAQHFVPIFLDAKPQRFIIDGVPHILKFADALRTVLVNNHPFNIEFGGQPVPIWVRRLRHFIRLTELPPGVVPGEVDIVSMSGVRGTAHVRASSPSVPSGAAGVGPGTGSEPAVEPPTNDHEPALPARVNRAGKKLKPKQPTRRERELHEPLQTARVEDRQMPADLFNAIQPGLPSLLGLLPGSSNSGYNCAPTNSSSSFKSTGAIPPISASEPSASSNDHAPSSSSSQEIPLLGSNLNMDDLFQRLIATGIVSSLSSVSDTAKDKEKDEERKKKIHEVDFKEPQTMKVKQPGIVDLLYSGIQCSSCGTRFPPEQTVKYSQHLDWHFRQNRRDKDSARKPQSRKWYYDVTDWIQFEEIEDMEDKGQNWFDAQQGETIRDEEPDDIEVLSVPANEFPEGAICELCHDKFEQFYNEEKEEWHLKHCIKVEEHLYHPLCYKDYRASVDSNEGIQVDEEDNPLGVTSLESEEHEIKSEDQTAEAKIDESDNKEMEMNASEKSSSDDQVLKEETSTETDLKKEPDEGELSTVEGECVKEEVADEPEEDSAGTDLAGESAADEEITIKTEVQDDACSDVEMPEEATAEEVNAEAEVKEEKEETKVEKEETIVHAPVADTTHASVPCSIDGNVELAQAPSSLSSAPPKIKINISKPLAPKPTESNEEDKSTKEEEDEEEKGADEEKPSSSEPPPPGEELIVLKPKLIGRKLTDLPPVARGQELSGLCSIM